MCPARPRPEFPLCCSATESQRHTRGFKPGARSQEADRQPKLWLFSCRELLQGCRAGAAAEPQGPGHQSRAWLAPTPWCRIIQECDRGRTRPFTRAQVFGALLLVRSAYVDIRPGGRVEADGTLAGQREGMLMRDRSPRGKSRGKPVRPRTGKPRKKNNGQLHTRL